MLELAKRKETMPQNKILALAQRKKMRPGEIALLLPEVFRRTLNQEGEGSAWRLPTINELEALVDCATHSPALPSGHPFADVQDTYWSSTTSLYEPDWAWALYLEKGATGVGQKRFAEFSVWAVASTVDR